jgi:hypothetical protein
MSGYRTLHLDDIPTLRFDDPELPAWKPVRHHLGVEAFGTNAYVGEQPGDLVIERHDELDDAGEAEHEELYLVVGGAARFTVDGETFDVPAGGLVHLSDPALVREATAIEPQTVVFAVGAPRGEAFVPSAWEEKFLRQGQNGAGDAGAPPPAEEPS